MRKDQIMISIRYYIYFLNYNAAAKTNKQKKPQPFKYLEVTVCSAECHTHTQILQNKSDLIK